MWEKLKNGYREFKESKPGARFISTYHRWREHSRGSAATILIFVVSGLLIIGGLLLALIPGVPGIVLGLLGFALIATRSRRMAIWLDWTELKARSLWHRYISSRPPRAG